MKRVIVPTINNFGPIQTKEGEYIEEKVKDSLQYKTCVSAMREACTQVLEKAAENAKYEVCQDDDGQESWIHKSNIFIDKRSILDTINEIE